MVLKSWQKCLSYISFMLHVMVKERNLWDNSKASSFCVNSNNVSSSDGGFFLLCYVRCRLRKKSWKNPGTVYLDKQAYDVEISIMNNWELFLEVLSGKANQCDELLYISPPLIRTPLKMLSLLERCPLVRGSTTCFHRTCCQKFVLYRGMSSLESVL